MAAKCIDEVIITLLLPGFKSVAEQYRISVIIVGKGREELHSAPNTDFDFGHGETIGQLRDSVASFCAKELAPRAAEIDRNNEFPGIYGRGCDLGVLGMTVPPNTVALTWAIWPIPLY